MRGFRKKTKKQIEANIRAREFQRDEEDRIIVNMTVRDDSNFLSVFSESDTPVINDDVAEYLEYWTCTVPPHEPLTLRVHSCCIDAEEEVLYRRGIQEYYTREYIANEQVLKKNRLLVFFLTVTGILVLFLMAMYDYHIGHAIWTEVIDIVAWVLLWEAVDVGVLENRSLLENRWRYLSYLSMKVEYLCEDKTN